DQSTITSSPGIPIRRLLPSGGPVWQNLSRFVRKKPLGAFGAVVALLLIVVAVFAPFIATHDPNATNAALVYAPPGSQYWLGGDQVGRDVFSRLVYGARVSLYAGLLSAFIGASIGMMVGVTSVHFGGKTDLIIQRIIDTLMAFPALILAIAIMAALGASLNNVVIALSIAFIPSTARVLRSQALAVKEMGYVLSAKAIGAGHARIIFRYMIPNCLALYIVLVTLFLGTAIVAEATLSFLGIGVPPDVPSWGGMLNGAAQTYVNVAPWLGVFPGLAIAIVVLAWNLLGDALRDVLDPRLRGTW
ncbi:MAG TPA: ABC transporter permease, partial [Xanthobacteraceae bacterium]